MRARQRDLRALRGAPHLEHEGAHAIAGIVPLAGDLLALGQDRLRLADLEDHVALLDTMHDTAEDLTFLADELGVDPFALGITHALQYHLLDGLRADASELGRPLGELELVVDLGGGVEALGLLQRDLDLRVRNFGDDFLTREGADGARFPIDLDAAVVGGGMRLLRAREQGGLHRIEEDLRIDPLLPCELLDDYDQFSVHVVRSRPRPWHVHVQTRLRHDVPRELHALPVVIQHQPLGRHFHQPP